MKVKSLFPLVGVCAILVSGAGPAFAADPVRTVDEVRKLESKVESVARKVMPATVALLSEKTESSGSGVITTADGLILTAAHVVQGTEDITVVFTDGEQVPGKVLGANYSKDIAMVQIQGKGPWPHAEMGESKSLVAGDWVIALGHSAGFDAARTPPVRFGHVISKGPGNFLTTDCTLIGGDSGGPLFDTEGRIVGINSSIGTAWTNNNHAGVDGFKEDWKRMRSGEAWGKLSMNPFANPEMPALGIEMGLPRNVRGVPVESVTPRSPSAAAGVRVGDVIQSLGGASVTDANTLLQVLAKQQPGEKVKLGILRGGKAMSLDVTLSPRNALYEEGGERREYSFAEEDVPLLLPEEKKAVELQNREFSNALTPSLTEAAKSTVRIWSGNRRLAYGTVVGDGTQVLTKWSEVGRARGPLRIDANNGEARGVTIQGVYGDEDLALLKVEGEALTPVKWSAETRPIGSMLVASQPDGRPAGVGVVSVLERNLRDTDLAYLGVIAQRGFDGPGVKVSKVDPKSGAAKAGIEPGNVILKVGDRAISGLLALQNALSGTAPGAVIPLTLDVNGKESRLDVTLGNRPKLPQFSGERLQVMERMGGAISQVRDSFSHAIQTDMRLKPNQVGGPVVDLDGKALGITLARADRTKSLVMPASAVMQLLSHPASTPEQALARNEQEEEQEMPNFGGAPERPQGRMIPGGGDRLRRHLSDMRRLQDHMTRELDELESRR